jgi:very-short-patch-repair endonuclease
MRAALPRYRDVLPGTQLAARRLRQRETPAEANLWNALRGRKLGGFKFRRQQPLGPYVVDFCCPEARLIVELDGARHDEQWQYDAARTKYLGALGYRVLRFRNADVRANLEDVLVRIGEVLIANTAPTRDG